MQAIEWTTLDDLGVQIDQVLRETPELRMQLHKRLAGIARRVVVEEISAKFSGGGTSIAGWQKEHVGSGGGYAAVRAIGTELDANKSIKGWGGWEEKPHTSENVGRDSPGAITNYLENGHIVRRPNMELATDKKVKRRRTRVNMVRVAGRHFYRDAKTKLPSVARAEIEAFAQELAGKLGG